MNPKFVYGTDMTHHVLAWKVIGQLTHSEVIPIVETIKNEVEKLPQGEVKLLVDNRKMLDENSKGIIFDTKVNEEWIKLQQWLIGRCSRVVVLCGTLMMQAQMNRLAATSGLDTVLKAFYNPLDQRSVIREAYQFLDIPSNNLVR